MKKSGVTLCALAVGLLLAACGEKQEVVAPQQTTGASAQESTSAQPAANDSAAQNAKPVAISLATDEVLLEALDASDYEILKDIFAGIYGGKPHCPEQEECDKYVVHGWDREMKAEPRREMLDLKARKAYQESLEGKAPHNQLQITRKTFDARYEQLKQMVATKNLCLLYRPWELKFQQNYYHFAGSNGRHAAIRANLFGTSGHRMDVFKDYGDIYMVKDGKYFVPIPAESMDDATYKKFASYSEVPEGDDRPAMKICGTLKGLYPKEQKQMTAEEAINSLAPSNEASLFELSKPIEIVQGPSLKPIDTIPLKWFR